jgi:hypothetical protein
MWMTGWPQALSSLASTATVFKGERKVGPRVQSQVSREGKYTESQEHTYEHTDSGGLWQKYVTP